MGKVSTAAAALLGAVTLATAALIADETLIEDGAPEPIVNSAAAALQDRTWLDTMDGDPASPEFVGPGRERPGWYMLFDPNNEHDNYPNGDSIDRLSPEGTHAHHQADCGDPKHDGSGYHAASGEIGELAYICKNHLMTFMGLGSNAILALTPAQALDTSAETWVVRFDLSTLMPQTRDWITLCLQPWGTWTAHCTEDETVFQGFARDAIQLKLEPTNGRWNLFVYRDGVQTEIKGTKTGIHNHVPACAGPDDPSTTCAPSAKNRYTHELIVTGGGSHVVFRAPEAGVTFIDAEIAPLGWTGPAVVTWIDARYNAHQIKGCESGPAYPGGECSNGWHMDNFSIGPAVAYTQIHGDRRILENGDTLTLDAPAPAGAEIVFAAHGNTVRLSFDGGPFVDAVLRAGSRPNAANSSYYVTPIPEGTQTVTAQLSEALWDPLVRALTEEVPPSPTPTPEPTSSPTSEPTPTSTPSATPTATPSPTPTASPSSTPSPTPSPSPTATPSPSPPPAICQLQFYVDGIGKLEPVDCADGELLNPPIDGD